jgi:hypothetical protein
VLVADLRWSHSHDDERGRFWGMLAVAIVVATLVAAWIRG